MSQLKVNSIIPVAGVPTGGGGGIVQVVSTNITGTSSVSLSANNYVDTPATVTITSVGANSKFLITATINGEASTADHNVGFALRRVIGGTTTAINIGDAAGNRNRLSFMMATSYYDADNDSTPSSNVLSPYLDSPNQAAGTAITYKLSTGGEGSGTFYFGRTVVDSNSTGYERLPNHITVMEVSA
tara:strand:+ start:25 stop:582 length:558 start_codon:yes stop_codon:yes gene_type:complete